MQKLTTIKAEAAKRAAEAQTLSSKKDTDLTPADRARIRELSTMQQQQSPVLAQLQRLYQQMVNEEDAKQTRIGMAEVRTVVAKLAKDQGVSQVFDATSLVYTPVDLTTAALAKVAKKK
jgi:Skp family chaperone for outer membrane proteins